VGNHPLVGMKLAACFERDGVKSVFRPAQLNMIAHHKRTAMRAHVVLRWV